MVVLDPRCGVEFSCAPYLTDEGDCVCVRVMLED
jgi:hypothetical protein